MSDVSMKAARDHLMKVNEKLRVENEALKSENERVRHQCEAAEIQFAGARVFVERLQTELREVRERAESDVARLCGMEESLLRRLEEMNQRDRDVVELLSTVLERLRPELVPDPSASSRPTIPGRTRDDVRGEYAVRADTGRVSTAHPNQSAAPTFFDVRLIERPTDPAVLEDMVRKLSPEQVARMRFLRRDWRDQCPGCKTGLGQPHLGACDVARCSVCGGQAISCDCPGDPSPTRWDGLWLMVFEAVQLGRFARFVPGQSWVPCGMNDDGAVAGLSPASLVVEWDAKSQHYFVPTQSRGPDWVSLPRPTPEFWEAFDRVTADTTEAT